MRPEADIASNVLCRNILLIYVLMCLILVRFSDLEQSVCDKNCICKFLTVDCSKKYVGTIPDGIPNDTKTLYFRENSISNVPPYSFIDLPQLQHLDLSLNFIDYIDSLAFVGPRQLLSLNLSHCGSFSANDLPTLNGLEHLEDLQLSSCMTWNLSASSLKNLRRLKRLDLSDSYLEDINREAFSGLDHLESINLSGNRFCLSKLDSAVFKPLTSLDTFSVFKTTRDLLCEPLKNSISLSKLQRLTIGIENLPIDILSWGTAPGLKSLFVHVLWNVSLSGNTFLHVDYLTTFGLYIRSIMSVSITSDLFQHFLNLKELFINVPSIEETLLLSLSNAMKNHKSLRTVRIYSRLETFSRETFLPLHETNIEALTLELGPALTIRPIALFYLPKTLQTLHILRSPVCFYDVVNSGFDMHFNLSLLKIHFHDLERFPTQLERFDSFPCGHQRLVKKRHIKSSYARTDDFTLFQNRDGEDEVEEDEVGGGKIESGRTSTKRAHSDGQRHYYNPPKRHQASKHLMRKVETYGQIKSRKLDYSRNFVHIPMEFYPLFPLDLESLDISFNTIYNIPINFGRIFSKVRNVNLSNTELSTIKYGTLQHMINLTYIDLQNNNLGTMVSDGKLFQNLVNLKFLNLANNSIRTMTPTMFENTNNLETLNLSMNHIISLDVDFSRARIRTIDLSSNYIQFISKTFLLQIEHLCTRSYLELNLARNPLRCTCDDLDFFKLTDSCSLFLKDADLTYCEFQNGTRTNFDHVNRILYDLERQCKSNTSVLVGSVAAAICLLFLITGTLAYRYRWKLRYFYYASKLKWFQNVNGTAAYQRIFDYDTFVSYCEEDNEFVRNELIPKLETGNNIRLCLHERDFAAGKSVACNISHAIHSSKRTTIVLTEDFLQSDWCMYELNMARIEDLYSDRNIILIIILHDLDLSKLPLDVMDLVRSKTYLKYPEEEGNDRETFWTKTVEFIR